MGRVVWINGSFGVGKTTVAKRLAHDLGSGFVLDPEPSESRCETISSRRASIPATSRTSPSGGLHPRCGLRSARNFDGIVIVPMTIASFDYFEEVVGATPRAVPLDHFTLMASRETILRRERDRPDDQSAWVEQMVDRVLPALADARFAEHIDTEKWTAEAVAQHIRSQLAL
jgi:hypothetical protein